MPNYNRHHLSSKPGICSLKFAVLAGTALLIILAGTNAIADPITFNITTSGSGWNTDSIGALQYAANIWGGLLSNSYAGETINIHAIFDNTLPVGALAGGSPVRAEYDGVPGAVNFYYPSATANHLALGDLHPGESEIEIKFSTSANWYYDTSNPASIGDTQYDFATISLHEIAHGLGFTSALTESMLYPFQLPDSSPCAGCWTGWYFDARVYNQAEGQFVISSSDRLALVTDPSNLVFTGGYAQAVNGGVYPTLYSPPDFVLGSSISHLSENPDYGYPGDLMNPHAILGGYNHQPSFLDLAILRDIGWTVAVPEPSSLLLLFSGAGILFFGKYGRRRK